MNLINGALKKRLAFPRNAWLDTFVVAGILAGVNSFLSPYDPGWMRLNPSPFFLLPILIGSRYGFGSGIASGALASLLTILGYWKMNGAGLGATVGSHGFFFGTMIVVGGICGEVQNYYRTRENQLSALHDLSKERLKKLDTDMVMMREAKGELERILATRDAELSTLDMDLRRLFDSEDDELYQNLLLLLNRQCRVTDAGLYFTSPDGKLRRKSILGSDQHLPLELIPSSIEMVNLSFKHKTTVTIPEFWQKAIGQHKNYLIIVPLLDSNEETVGVLIVTGIPFIALNKKTVHLITLICRWTSRIVEIRSKAPGSYRVISGIESQRLFTPAFFKQTLDLAYQSFQQHNLPSALVLFTLPDEKSSSQDEFEKSMMTFMRGGDFPATAGINVPHLLVLLPLSGERGSAAFVERISLSFEKASPFKTSLKSQVFIFDRKRTVEELLEEVTRNEINLVPA